MGVGLTVRLELPFAVLARRGREVTWLRIRHAEHEATVEVVVAPEDGILFCEERMLGLFAHEAAVTDPLVLARPRGWVVDEQLTGTILGQIVATSSADQGAAVRTTLFITPAAAGPFR